MITYLFDQIVVIIVNPHFVERIVALNLDIRPTGVRLCRQTVLIRDGLSIFVEILVPVAFGVWIENVVTIPSGES